MSDRRGRSQRACLSRRQALYRATIALAVALGEGCGAEPIVMAEERFLPPIEAATRALAPSSLPAIRGLPEAVTSHAGARRRLQGGMRGYE
ncbi:MAG: hypothetical protein ACE5HK_03135 [Candidatus Methylomirabilales bacterium]